MALEEDEDLIKPKMKRRDFLKGVGVGAVVAGVGVAGVAELSLLNGGGGGTSSTTSSTSSSSTTTTTAGQLPTPVLNKFVTLTVNGSPQTLQVQSGWTLLRVLRDQLKLYGAKEGCDRGECGACTVILDGKAVNSCQILAIEADGMSVTTIEGIGTPLSPHPLQVSWAKLEGTQCGACAPGMILQAKALLDKTPKPTVAQIREALAGNLCVCGNYRGETLAVMDAAGVTS
jgi:aerobic carbon-monoxide dehydrogenase small subunit